jgi:UDP-N-acetylmuramyl pentapeptide synthase
MKTLQAWFGLYRPRYASVLVYMLQNTEYRVGPYLKWYWRTQDFSKVMYRRTLDQTRVAKLLRLALLAGMGLQIILGLLLIVLWRWNDLVAGELFGLALIVSYPLVWAHLVVVPLILGRELQTRPNERRLIAESKQIFADHPGVKIAVAGSYGKTSMKELLLTVLGEGKNVAATPGNKNVASSHAYFAKRLTGNEDVLIIEYGEGAPGDVARFAATTQPTHGVITGLAPAHLDRYKTLEAAGKDIFSLASYLKNKHIYANGESAALLPFAKKSKSIELYTATGSLGWKVKDIALTPLATSFTLTKGKRSLKLTSGLLGKHQVGPLSLAAALALELGLTEKQVKNGVAKTVPYEHRMQARNVGGASVIDDTYNGNLEGIRVGTELLASLKAKRKIYVTPGLVDQGKDTKAIHQQVGKYIASAKPDLVILMKNSVTASIQKGLKTANFKGEIRVESDPLDFYTNLEHFVAAGDVVLMQNDWTDNYA